VGFRKRRSLRPFNHPPTPTAFGGGAGRFPVEQYCQRGKSDLGLDHFEDRSWLGFHHHLVLAAAVAYLFVTAAY
jgi:hypothetical protein